MVVVAGEILPQILRANNHPNSKQKRYLKEIYNYRCIKCGMHQNEITPDRHGTTLTIHHIIRVVCGGRHTKSNMVVLCRDCHNNYHEKIEPKRIPFWDWICESY